MNAKWNDENMRGFLTELCSALDNGAVGNVESAKILPRYIYVRLTDGRKVKVLAEFYDAPAEKIFE